MTHDTQGTKDASPTASQTIKTGCFILPTTGFFARFPTGVLPV